MVELLPVFMFLIVINTQLAKQGNTCVFFVGLPVVETWQIQS